MPVYSPLVVVYVCVQLISLSLLVTLIYILINTNPYFTRTIFQLCICTLITGLLSLPLIIIYGNSLLERALDTPLCIIQNKLVGFFKFPLKLLPAALSIYLWLETCYNYHIEDKYFWHISGIIWGLTILVNGIELIVTSNEENWGVRAAVLSCKQTPSYQAWLNYIIPTSVLAITSTIITVHSVTILFRRWRNHTRNQNRYTAITLGDAARLVVFSFFYSFMILASLIPSIFLKINNDHDLSGDNNKLTFIDFASSTYGTILFMIFGTTKKAALFLPCCYYSPPKDRVAYVQDHESIDLQPYNPGGNDGSSINQPPLPDSPKIDSGFQSVSSRITIIEQQA
ncbi:9065_t:CDS:2 [Funneliformis geosporum]|uniref:9065_t:CDS:1 n=1 Tax=Funneliformis geosporum TaxID=1117311 RepID=A0A9W4SGG6_9GLOM|nr:9065_t:CDS:2 [Funneliformis geosporum]